MSAIKSYYGVPVPDKEPQFAACSTSATSQSDTTVPVQFVDPVSAVWLKPVSGPGLL